MCSNVLRYILFQLCSNPTEEHTLYRHTTWLHLYLHLPILAVNVSDTSEVSGGHVSDSCDPPQPPERDLLSGSSQWEQHSIVCILSQLGLELEGKTAIGCRFRLGISEGHYKEGKNHFYLHKSVVRGETRDNFCLLSLYIKSNCATLRL